MSALPAAPRQLSRLDAWAVKLGAWSLFFGLGLWTLVSLLGWTLIAAYGVKFSSLRRYISAHEVVVGRVEASGKDRLWSGEPVLRTTALFSVGSATYRAVGYGPSSSPLAKGDQVDVLLSSKAPEYAWIHGLDPYPLNLGWLLRGAALGLVPALVLCLLGLSQGYREHRLVLSASCVAGRRGRHWAIPRPFSAVFLTRYYTKGELFSTWSVGPDVGETPAILWASKGKPAVVAHLFPNLEVDGTTVRGLSLTRRLRLFSVVAMLAFQAAMLLGFLLT